MKSLYLFCEYDVSVYTVEMLEKNCISFDDILNDDSKLNKIYDDSYNKRKKIVELAQKINLIEREHSVYELLKYGLSLTYVEKLFLKNIDITEINYKILEKNNITRLTAEKVIRAYKKWAKTVNYKIPLTEDVVKDIIKSTIGHSFFELEDVENILINEGYNCENLVTLLDEINLTKKGKEYFYPFELTDLLDFGLSNMNFKFLIENNIPIDQIDSDTFLKYKISSYRVSQILEAFDSFARTYNYIKPVNCTTILKDLIQHFKHINYSIDDVYEIYLEQDRKHIDKCLEELINLGKIKMENNIFSNKFPALSERLENIKDPKRYDMVVKKLSGMTLEQIGQDYGLTRERIRQIFSKEIAKIKYVDEDKYADNFKKYDFDEKFFCTFYNENKQVYNYLKERYQSGDLEVYEMLELENLTSEQIEMIRKKYNLIFYNDEYIAATKVSILIAILKKNEDKLTFEEIINIYNEIIENNKLELATISQKDYHNIDSALERNHQVLNSFGNAYRYYNWKNLDSEEIEELKKLFEIESGVYSAELFFKDNPLLMKKLDIRDEYELHNLFRKVLGNFNEKIVYGRMPDIFIDCNDKLAFIDEKIQELSPITLDEFAEYIYQNYGHKVNTMKAYVLSNFNKYISTRNYVNQINVDCPLFTEEQYQIMKEFLKDDIYSNITIKQVLTDEFNVNDFKLLNNLNFSKLGYKVRGNYIMKSSIGSLETYLREKVLNQDYYEVSSELKKIGSTYSSYIYRLIYDKILFKIDEDRYITISKLNKMGIFKNDIEEFIENIKKIIPENKYFNLYVLTVDFKNKMFEFDFPNCLYENLIMIIDDVKMFKVKNNSIFIKTTENVNIEKFINSFITKQKTYISEIKNQIKKNFDIDLHESYIKEFINKNKYYLQPNTNCVYISKEAYENEINQWDILKYID